VALTADGATKKSELEAAAASIKSLSEKVAEYEAQANEAKETTDAKIAELNKQLGDARGAGTAAVAEIQAQMEQAEGLLRLNSIGG
jgi:predicted  nucleic acid-binding Zn-ribbon protein